VWYIAQSLQEGERGWVRVVIQSGGLGTKAGWKDEDGWIREREFKGHHTVSKVVIQNNNKKVRSKEKKRPRNFLKRKREKRGDK